MVTSTLVSTGEVSRASRSGSARATADANRAANFRALSVTQPRLAAALTKAPPALRPIYARDGSLTTFDAGGKWWHGCSVPLRAAEAMLATLDVKGRVACLLAPTLAAHVRVSLERSRADQAIVTLCPDLIDLGVMLACEDFSAFVRSHRLWFAWGDDWAAELKQLFSERPGLATPAQFIRLPTTAAEQTDPLVSAAQAVFAEANAARSKEVAVRRDDWRPPAAGRARLYVIAPSHFRLWDDAGAVLAETLLAQARADAEANVVVFDPDDPACSSSLALLAAAAECSAIVAADTARAHLPGVVPASMPWVTWVTRPASIPSYASATERDALVLADPAWRTAAATAGWPSQRVSVGGWPAQRVDPNAKPSRLLAVVSDTRPLVMPTALEEYSSHQLLWKHIAAELAADPFAIENGPGLYLERRMARLGVGAEGFNAALFLERLILPAYEQGIVRTLIAEGLPLRLFGAGWQDIAEFAHLAAGPVTSRDELAGVAGAASAIIDASPLPDARPLHRLGRPVVNAAGASRRRFIDDVTRALAGTTAARTATEAISLRQIVALVGAS